MLIKTDDGFVIIDHKSYPGDNAAERALKYSAQLAAYRAVIQASIGIKVICLLVYMPVSSLMFELAFSGRKL